MTGARVVVTDGEQRAALAAVRSLGAAGHHVVVCASRPSLAGASRHAAAERLLPDPLREADAYVEALRALCDEARAEVLLPVTEPSLLAVLPERARFAASIPFVDVEPFRAICDKERLLAAGAHHGIAVPAQRVVRAPAEAEAAIGGMAFPVVLKPARSVAGEGGERVKTSVGYARDASALRDALAALPAAAYPVLLQQRIEGPGTAISLLLWDGEVRAAFGHRRLREKPPSGGVSTLRESIPLDDALLARSVALLGEFGWRGVAMVEFKVDARTGTPYLMEVNGRLWGSLQLAIDAGVDFPRLLVECALGRPPAPVTAYAAGVRSWWEWGDVDHVLTRLRRPPSALSLPAGAPGRWRTVGAFLRSLGPGDRSEVFRLRDPGPFVRETRDWLRRR